VDLITLEDLEEKLAKREPFQLVMTLGELAFKARHIPGSRNIHSKKSLLEQLRKDDDIVVYCTNELCPASIMAYRLLVDHGYSHVRRFAGGLEAWDRAGLPMEGEQVEPAGV
jgi:rhodanese-related sulfurtransferase